MPAGGVQLNAGRELSVTIVELDAPPVVEAELRALLVRLGIATSAKLGIATSASPTGSMLVVTDDLHPMVHTEPYSSWLQTLFQLVQSKICLISSDLVGSKYFIPVGSG